MPDELAEIISDEYRARQLLFKWFIGEDGLVDFNLYQEAVELLDYTGENSD